MLHRAIFIEKMAPGGVKNHPRTDVHAKKRVLVLTNLGAESSKKYRAKYRFFDPPQGPPPGRVKNGAYYGAILALSDVCLYIISRRREKKFQLECSYKQNADKVLLL